MTLDDTAVVLVATPNPTLRLRLCADLGRAGVVGLPARDPLDAIGKVDRYREVSLALVDGTMPGLGAMVAHLRQRRPGLELVGLGPRGAFAGLGLRRVLTESASAVDQLGAAPPPPPRVPVGA